jgi:hypothetical protein
MVSDVDGIGQQPQRRKHPGSPAHPAAQFVHRARFAVRPWVEQTADRTKSKWIRVRPSIARL